MLWNGVFDAASSRRRVAWFKISCCLSNGSVRTASRIACSTDMSTSIPLFRILPIGFTVIGPKGCGYTPPLFSFLFFSGTDPTLSAVTSVVDIVCSQGTWLFLVPPSTSAFFRLVPARNLTRGVRYGTRSALKGASPQTATESEPLIDFAGLPAQPASRPKAKFGRTGEALCEPAPHDLEPSKDRLLNENVHDSTFETSDRTTWKATRPLYRASHKRLISSLEIRHTFRSAAFARYDSTRSVVQVGTPQPKKSVSSVQSGQPSARDAARTGQSSSSRFSMRARAIASKEA